jgi:hypothetical protein
MLRELLLLVLLLLMERQYKRQYMRQYGMVRKIKMGRRQAVQQQQTMWQ